MLLSGEGKSISPKPKRAEESLGALGGGGVAQSKFVGLCLAMRLEKDSGQFRNVCGFSISNQRLLRIVHRVQVVEVIGDGF